MFRENFEEINIISAHYNYIAVPTITSNYLLIWVLTTEKQI